MTTLKDYPPFKYKITKYKKEKCVKITGFDNSTTNPVIPSHIEGLPVRIIGAYAFNCSKMESIQLPNTLSEIHADAFALSRLKRISIPDSVKVICSEFCMGCHFLEEVKWSKSATVIPDSAFQYCASLKRITNIDSVEMILPSAFEYTGFSSFILPRNIKALNKYAFANCDYLKTVKMTRVPYVQKDTFANSNNVQINCRGSTKAAFWAKMSGLPIYNPAYNELNAFLADMDTDIKKENENHEK